MPRPDIVYRSLLQTCDRGTDVHPVSGCSHLHAEYSINDVSTSHIWTNTPMKKCSPPAKVESMMGFVLVHKVTSDDAVKSTIFRSTPVVFSLG